MCFNARFRTVYGGISRRIMAHVTGGTLRLEQNMNLNLQRFYNLIQKLANSDNNGILALEQQMSQFTLYSIHERSQFKNMKNTFFSFSLTSLFLLFLPGDLLEFFSPTLTSSSSSSASFMSSSASTTSSLSFPS